MVILRFIISEDRSMSSRRAIRGILLIIILASVVAQLPHAAARAQVDPAQELADRYAPIAVLRDQTAPCDRDGEGYFPAPVESVLGNPGVALKIADTGSSATDTIIKMAPSAQDIANLDDQYYLDFPGNPRRPGCVFETDFQQYAAAQGLKPTTYAHIVVDEDAHRVVIQYWLWWYFNDWNNLHEGDWEVVQVVFDADSVETALAGEPIRYAYAQHGGGELADPDDRKLKLVDGHPKIYPAAGSHATHFEQELFLGWGENGTGFGCDNARPTGTETPLEVVVVPNDPDPDSAFGWATFGGRWGERQPWEFNGPRSPNLTRRWADPVTDMANWRSSSLIVPGSNSFGPNVTDTFCALSSGGAAVISWADQNQRALLVGLLGLVLAIGTLGFQMRRRIGWATRIYRENWKLFVKIGLAAVPIGIVFDGLAWLLRQFRPGSWLVEWFNSPSQTSIASLFLATSFQYLAILLLVVPATVAATAMVLRNQPTSVTICYTTVLRRIKPILICLLLLSVVTGFLISSFVGILLAVFILVRWQFYTQGVLVSGARTWRAALNWSREVVRYRWIPTSLNTIVFQAIAIVPGPIVGFLLMVWLHLSPVTANLISSLIYVVTVPLATIGLTLFYIEERGNPYYREPAADDRVVESGPAVEAVQA
ncbi:MAG: hypothetical protein KC438_02335 [Thermomicrobiales bacterium]|nr:hypothetical protein [Thermomicrobiales bacterium]